MPLDLEDRQEERTHRFARLIAVVAGHFATFLPDALIKSVALVIFLVGGVLLIRSAPGADEEEKQTEEEYAAKAVDTRTGLRAVGASFLVLFAAEWGDLSQLLTIRLIDYVGAGVCLVLAVLTGIELVAG